MKILLDAQAVFWRYSDPAKISKRAVSMIEDGENTILVSAATAWELAILPRYLAEEGFEELPVSVSQATRAGLLPLHHRDPFDRLLAAQAQDLSIPVLSNDRLFDLYDVKRLW